MKSRIPKREEMELPGNVRSVLLDNSRVHNWIQSAKIANLTHDNLRKWREHLQTDSFISEAITQA